MLMNIIKYINFFLKQFLDYLFEIQCVNCGENVSENGLCPNCWFNIKFSSNHNCKMCGDDLPENEYKKICFECFEKPKKYYMRYCCLYDDISRKIVIDFKHGDKIQNGKIIANLMSKKISFFDGVVFDYVVPVPIHYFRLLKRKFNQSYLISKYIIKNNSSYFNCKKPNNNILKRVKNTSSQGKTSTKQRIINLTNAFKYCGNKNELKGKNILLVDDVFTSGATINECVKELSLSGANIYVIIFAKTNRR